MKKCFLLIGFCVALQPVLAQNNPKTKSDQDPIDSLRQLLEKASDDTNKVNILNALSDKLERSGDYDPAKKYAEDALALAQSIYLGKTKGWLSGEATAYRRLGNIYSDVGNHTEALKNHFASLKIWEQTGDKKGMANAYNNIGISYNKEGSYREALKSHLAALKIREEIGDRQGMAYSHVNIGNAHIQLGNYTEALKNNFASLKLFEDLSDKKGIASCYNNIGSIYYYQNNYPEALKNYLAALKIKEETGDRRALSTSYNNIGNIHEELGNYDDALKNYLAGLRIDEEFGNKQGIAHDLNNIGNLYSARKDYPNALKNLSACLAISEEIGNEERIAEACLGLGNVYLEQLNFTAALPYVSRGLSAAKETGNKFVMSEAYEEMAKLYGGLHDYRKAFEYQQMFTELKDTLLNEENLQQIAQLKEQYESEKKDAQIALLSKNNELQIQQSEKQRIIKNFFIGGFVLVLLIAFLFINRLRLQQFLKLEQIRNKISTDLHDDIGSTLSSIAIYSDLVNAEVKEKSERASSLLEVINENARTTIESMSDMVWTINPENDRFENILTRMRTFAAGILEAKNIEITFLAPAALSISKLSMEKRKNLYLIFKEAVNNVAKYSACKNCFIQLSLEGQKLTMEITDDGIGFDINDHPPGNGQINMKRRSDDLNGTLDIKSSKGNGTRILLSFTT